MKFFRLLLLIVFVFITSAASDLTVVGFTHFSYSLGRITVALIDMLKDDLSINVINTRPASISLEDVPPAVQAIIKDSGTTNYTPIAILTDHITMPNLPDSYCLVPESSIKVALSMVESTKVPDVWVDILNREFDAVFVPDSWLLPLYEKAGVVIPVFVLPHNLYLEDFLKLPQKRARPFHFNFGVCSLFNKHKNLELLLKAFSREFNSSKEAHLKVHIPHGDNAKIKKLQKKYHRKNIDIRYGKLSWDQYVSFMQSLNAYTLVSKGEGFSITPREAVAAGIPCILSDNTAHKKLCKKKFVRAVPAPFERPSDPESYGPGNVGINFDCSRKGVCRALREVYERYADYLSYAQEGRDWVKKYTHKNLRSRYLSFFKPTKEILGAKNYIARDHVETTCLKLYTKLRAISKPQVT